jgi:hypothetical protein
VRATYIQMEGMGGIESFVKGMVVIGFAQNDRGPQNIFHGSFGRGSIEAVP